MSITERQLLEQYAPWGCVLFGRNLSSLAQGARLLSELRSVLQRCRGAEHPVGLFGVDEEGGRVSRLPRPFPATPSAQELARSGDDALCSHTLLRAGVARALGFNMIFAPVCDVLSADHNTVIGDRSFGSDTQSVVHAATLVAQTLLACGVCPVLKHFPSHGSVAHDTHRTTARCSDPVDMVVRRDMDVYRSIIAARAAPAVMTCHVVFDAFDPKQPATLSKVLLSDWLRRELGFTGLVVSDDLRMNAIAERFGLTKTQDVAAASDELSRLESAHRAASDKDLGSESYLGDAACAALVAGCDVVLCCRSIEREAAVLQAVSRALAQDGESGPFAALCRERARRVFETALRFNGALPISAES